MAIRKKTGRKGGPVTKTKKTRVLNEIKDLIISGRNTYTSTELGKKFKISRDTISKYTKEAYSLIPKDDIEEVYLDIKGIYDRMRKRLLTLWDKFESGEIECITTELKILREMRNLIKDFTKLLEDFHKKTKAADNINLNADITQKKISVSVNLVHNDDGTAKIE